RRPRSRARRRARARGRAARYPGHARRVAGGGAARRHGAPPRRHAAHGHAQPRGGRGRRPRRHALRRPRRRRHGEPPESGWSAGGARGLKKRGAGAQGTHVMTALLRWLLLRRLARQRGRTLLIVVGVALGVAMVVAIRLASDSALASFGDTVDAVAGRANLCVSAVADGFDERLLGRIRRTPGVLAAAPVVEV